MILKVLIQEKHTKLDKERTVTHVGSFICALVRNVGDSMWGKSKTPFKIRHSNHKREIKTEIGGIGHHYGGRGECNYENLSIQIIEQVHVKTPINLAKREQWRQNQLRVFVRNGHMNHCYWKIYT